MSITKRTPKRLKYVGGLDDSPRVSRIAGGEVWGHALDTRDGVELREQRLRRARRDGGARRQSGEAQGVLVVDEDPPAVLARTGPGLQPLGQVEWSPHHGEGSAVK